MSGLYIAVHYNHRWIFVLFSKSTLACIEREVILNELYYEASEEELENLN